MNHMDGPRDYILSEATQTNVTYYLYAESKKKKKDTNEPIYKTQT